MAVEPREMYAREIIRELLADLKSPFPREVLAIATLRMGDTSVEHAEAYLAAAPKAAVDQLRIAIEALEEIERISYADSQEESVARRALAALSRPTKNGDSR